MAEEEKMIPNPEVSIILVSYNTRDYILAAIDAVYAQTSKVSFELIVVDNDSKDGSLEAINEKFPEVITYNSGANLGFAGGVQYGVKRSSGNYILLLNPDTEVVEGAIDKLVGFAKDKPQNGIWGGITLDSDLGIDTRNAWSRHDFLSLLFTALGISKIFSKSCFFNKYNYGCWDRTTVKEVDIISGCFFLITRDVWNELGGLDPAFFMYAEEADLCIRAKRAGYQPIITPDSKLVHVNGVSHSHFSNKLIMLLRGKSELIMRHDSPLIQPLYKGLLLLYVFNKLLASRLKGNDSDDYIEWKKVYESKNIWLKGYR